MSKEEILRELAKGQIIEEELRKRDLGTTVNTTGQIGFYWPPLRVTLDAERKKIRRELFNE